MKNRKTYRKRDLIWIINPPHRRAIYHLRALSVCPAPPGASDTALRPSCVVLVFSCLSSLALNFKIELCYKLGMYVCIYVSDESPIANRRRTTKPIALDLKLNNDFPRLHSSQ